MQAIGYLQVIKTSCGLEAMTYGLHFFSLLVTRISEGQEIDYHLGTWS